MTFGNEDRSEVRSKLVRKLLEVNAKSQSTGPSDVRIYVSIVIPVLMIVMIVAQITSQLDKVLSWTVAGILFSLVFLWADEKSKAKTLREPMEKLAGVFEKKFHWSILKKYK